ncbi:MAG: hypothetical protein NVSMB65_01650 [Chloroflexota bacterium]
MGTTERGRGAGQAETGRIEAFSDGVFAVAITLLALNLTTPHLADGQPVSHLAAALLAQWPAYLAYVLSFLTILIMWVNHHALFLLIRRTDHLFLLLNGLLLLVITATPFATALLAAYLLDPEKRVAQVVYSGLSLLMALVYNRMWAYASHEGRLLAADADKHQVQSITKHYRFGPLLYVVSFLAAFASAEVSLTLCILLAIYFAVPSTVARTLLTPLSRGTPRS